MHHCGAAGNEGGNMSTRRKIGSFAAAAALTVSLVGLVSAPSYAADSGVTSLGTGASSGAVQTTPDGYADTPEVRKLKSLVGTQTQAEILAIQEQGASGADVQALAGEDGTIIAAYVKAKPSVHVLAVSPVGPGCTSDGPTNKASACVRTTSGTPYGYTGGGTLKTNIKSAKTGFAGNDGYDTGFWTGNQVALALRGVTVNLASKTITSIVRTPH
jgi:hypothetical protein